MGRYESKIWIFLKKYVVSSKCKFVADAWHKTMYTVQEMAKCRSDFVTSQALSTLSLTSTILNSFFITAIFVGNLTANSVALLIAVITSKGAVEKRRGSSGLHVNVKDGLTEFATHFLQMIDAQVETLVSTLVTAAVTTLEGVAEWNSEMTPGGHASRRFPVLFHAEAAIVDAKGWSYLVQNSSEQLRVFIFTSIMVLAQPRLAALAPVDEDVFLPGVSVKVAEHHWRLSDIVKVLEETFGVIDRRMQHRRWI